jgi:minor extracellular protease Epr
MSAADQETRRYVILPALTAFNAEVQTASRAFSRKLALAGRDAEDDGEVALDDDDDGGGGEAPIKVVDAIDGDAITLVEMTEDQSVALSRRYPGLQIAPEGVLHLLRAHPFAVSLRSTRIAATSAQSMEISAVDPAGVPIVGAQVTVVYSKKNQTGRSDLMTDARGRVTLLLPPRLVQVDMVIVTPLSGHWPMVAENIAAAPGVTALNLTSIPIVAGHQDAVDTLCGVSGPKDGAGVKIAIIDAGVTAGPGIKIAFGANTTGAEDPSLSDDNGMGHGTHVAGIIARLAPAAELYVYRVFEAGAETANEAAIAKAIRDAVERECDLINLSLGQKDEPIAIVQEVRRARAFGVLCVAAAGNDYGGLVEYPARSTHVQAVSACGDRSAWPRGAPVQAEVAATPAAVGSVFFANFSNVGREIDLMMPGAGIVSYVSGNAQGVMSGTSMACPAAVGMIAKLLTKAQNVLGADRNQQRSDDMAKLAFQHATAVGFGAIYEGKGLLK